MTTVAEQPVELWDIVALFPGALRSQECPQR